MKKRKTVCGDTINEKITQVNLKITKQGKAKLFEAKEEKPKEGKKEKPAEKPKEAKQEKKEEKPKEVKKEAKAEEKSKE